MFKVKTVNSYMNLKQTTLDNLWTENKQKPFLVTRLVKSSNYCGRSLDHWLVEYKSRNGEFVCSTVNIGSKMYHKPEFFSPSKAQWVSGLYESKDDPCNIKYKELQKLEQIKAQKDLEKDIEIQKNEYILQKVQELMKELKK